MNKPLQHVRQPSDLSTVAKPALTTVDVVDHSRNTDALERALDRAACCPDWRKQTSEAGNDEWVRGALEQLEGQALSVTVTDYRLIGWGKHDPIPRGWGCYRVNHLTSGQWLEMVASRSMASTTPRAIAVMNNMATLLQVLLAVPGRGNDDGNDNGNEEDIDIDIILDEPTEPGWPPGEEPSEGHWWDETAPAKSPPVANARRVHSDASTAAQPSLHAGTAA